MQKDLSLDFRNQVANKNVNQLHLSHAAATLTADEKTSAGGSRFVFSRNVVRIPVALALLLN